MKQVMRMLSPRLDDFTAQSIAIKIRVEEVQTQFISCTEVIDRKIEDYRPRIAEVLIEYQE